MQVFIRNNNLIFSEGCLGLLDSLPETVYRVSDLFLVVTQRNGIKWQKEILTTIVQEVYIFLQEKPS
jgi:hypothetical protein